MASVVQFATNEGTGSASYTLTLPSGATAGNDIIVVSSADSATHDTAETFDGNAMTTDLDAVFGLIRFARYRVASGGGTVATIGFGSTTSWRGVILEVNGLDSGSIVDATVNDAATGEGSATSHSCEYTNSGSPRWGVVWCDTFSPDSITAANGSEIYGPATRYAAVVRDALASGSGSIDFTLSNARSMTYSLVTYAAAAAGGGAAIGARANHYNRLRR